jgi:RNase P subunit RPR2
MEDCIHLNEKYQMLFCRLCKSAIRPGASIELHFRQVHQLKGKVLKDIKDCYGVMELADPKPSALPAGLDNF